MMTDFEKFAMSQGIGTNKLDGYAKYNLRNGIIEPYILEERTLNCAPMSVFSRLMYDKIIFLGSAIDEDVANIINAQLLYLNSITDKEEDIKMFINSPGGSCIDGLAIYDVMNFIDPDVSTYCMGMCASMGSILVSSGAKGKRFILPNGEVMIHQVSSATGRVQNADLQIAAKESQKIQNTLYNILAVNTGKSFEEIEMDADRDHWFSAQEAVDYGLIDSIVKRK
jgi:ATP-dependent Clp protease protease subunit